jgi:small-conductance mechanosensitive channel
MRRETRIRCWGVRLLLAVFLLLLAGPLMAAKEADSLMPEVRGWWDELTRFEGRVASKRLGGLEMRDIRRRSEAIIADSAKIKEEATLLATNLKGLLDALGPEPAVGAPKEDTATRARRSQLTRDLSLAEGRAKQAGLVAARAEQVLASLGRLSRDQLKEDLLQRKVSPLDPATWAIAIPEAAHLYRIGFVEAPAQWWQGLAEHGRLGPLLGWLAGLSVAALAVGWPVRLWLLRRFGRHSGEPDPSFARRLVAGLAEGTARGLLPVVLVVVAWRVVKGFEVEDSSVEGLAEALVHGLGLFFFGYAMINAAIAPRAGNWGLISLPEPAAALLSTRLKAALAVFLVTDTLGRAVAWMRPSEEFDSASALLAGLAVGAALMLLPSPAIWRRPATEESEGEERPSKGGPGALARGLARLAILAIPGSALLGYAPFSAYLARVLVLLMILLGGWWFAHTMMREAVAATLEGRHRVGRWVCDNLGLTDKGQRGLAFWVGGIGDVVLFFLAILLALPILGLGANETAVWAGKLLRGVQIGSFTFSILDGLIALGLFSLVMVVTRLIQRGLERHVLPNVSADRGVRDALSTGVGYVGFVVAILVLVGSLGLNLGNLAIIAGALSVGVGFGLQNVFNNFVSGLILLIERPIKPGDWVVVGSHEGTVKKVNVRSTEIETFQRASVIIPNADLISNAVVNWTHKNLMGRLEVKVGVAYGSDIQKVKDILLECVKAQPLVARYPEPFVLFQNFGESSLDFELRAYLTNIEYRMATASDLRFHIHRRFAEEGIEIPFPQRVLHMAPPDGAKAKHRDHRPTEGDDDPVGEHDGD